MDWRSAFLAIDRFRLFSRTPAGWTRAIGATPPTRRVDVDHAHLIASAFLEAPRTSTDRLALAAYADLEKQANQWFARVTGPSARTPIRVVHTRCPEPYASGRELSEQVRADHVLELCPARYDRDRSHPVLDMSAGGTYDRFRAVHDIVSHGWLGYGFDRDGEFSAWLAEDRMYDGLARSALATELHAEHSVRWTTGDVAEHKASLLAPWIVHASRQPHHLRLGVGSGPGFDARSGQVRNEPRHRSRARLR
jgi:hypothetical protein